MGEYEKLIGEHGEATAGEFFDLIGWRPRKENFDIPCTDNDHKNKKHGIDAYFNYKSPLVDEVLDHIIVSVKYSVSDYPTNPAGKFKEYLQDIAVKISCFDRSRERSESNRSFMGVKRSRTFGLLLWFHGDDNGRYDVVTELENIRFREEGPIKARPVYVLDRRQMKFLVESISYVNTRFSSFKITFSYHHTGSNISAVQRATDGEYLPIQLLVSGVLVFRLENNHQKQVLACICTSELFSKEALEKIVGLAQYMTSNFASETIISFRDYRPEKHKTIASDVLMSFTNRDFAKSVKVEAFKNRIV